MTTLHIDFETRSAIDLRKVGLHNYARHPSTDVWCMAGAVGEQDPTVLDGLPMKDGTWRLAHSDTTDRFLKHVQDGHRVMAHNAPFELAIWNHIMVPRYGWPVLKPTQVHCTMAKAYAMALPGALEDAALALGMNVLKDRDGRALMLRYARPWREEPLQWMDECPKFTVGGVGYTGKTGLQRLHAYCQQDVRVERELDKLLLPLSDKEREVWLMDYAINQRGVAVDVETAAAAVAMTEQVKERCNLELGKLTNGAVLTVTAVAALKDWTASKGVVIPSLAKQEVVDLLDNDLPPDVRRALILRQESGKASIAKLDRMLSNVGDDGRLRDMYQYHGAGPGRWAGRAVQTHNLPREMPTAETVEKILELVRDGAYDTIDAIYGPPMTVISKCLRSFFVAPDGKVLISGDWANVEGRGGMWFAGEDWKLKAFRKADAGDGPGVYELTASRMFGLPVESIKNPSEERQWGKVCDLAFMYGGGIGSGKTMGKTYGVKATDEQWDEWKDLWRDAHPAVAGVHTYNERTGRWFRKGGIWKAVENAAINAVRDKGTAYTCGHPSRPATFKVAGSFLWCLLPSGRTICYPYPKILPGLYGPQLTYMSVPSQEDRRKGKIIDDPKNASNWARMSTWGGTLYNNIVQGFCRDFLAGGMLTFHRKGASIVLHTHDDINLEVERIKAQAARDAMADIMCTPPPWAEGFPLFAKCDIMKRYGK